MLSALSCSLFHLMVVDMFGEMDTWEGIVASSRLASYNLLIQFLMIWSNSQLSWWNEDEHWTVLDINFISTGSLNRLYLLYMYKWVIIPHSETQSSYHLLYWYRNTFQPWSQKIYFIQLISLASSSSRCPCYALLARQYNVQEETVEDLLNKIHQSAWTRWWTNQTITNQTIKPHRIHWIQTTFLLMSKPLITWNSHKRQSTLLLSIIFESFDFDPGHSSAHV